METIIFLLIFFIIFYIIKDFNNLNLHYKENINNDNVINLYTNYKYSIEHKLSDEMRKSFVLSPININIINKNLSNNFFNNKFSNDIFMISELQYRNLPLETNDLTFIMSYFDYNFLFLIDNILNYVSLKDIINNQKKIKIGIVNNIIPVNILKKILLLLGLNNNFLKFSGSYNYIIELYEKKEINTIFLCSNKGDIFLNYILNNKFTNIIGIELTNNIKREFPYLFKTKLRFEKKNKKNNKKLVSTFSTRLLFLCNVNVKKEIIYNFLKLIYKNLNTIYSNLNIYYTKFVKEDSLREINPNSMFYCYPGIKYHIGAIKFYEEMEYIKYDKDNKLEYENKYNNYIKKEIRKFNLSKIGQKEFYDKFSNKNIIFNYPDSKKSKLFWDERNLFNENKINI